MLSAPPPSSGGIGVMQLLGMKDALAPRSEGLARNSAPYGHLTAEMTKRVFAERAKHLADRDFVRVPVASLLDPAYIARRAAEVDPDRISAMESVRPGLAGRHTTHWSIVDRWSNAVANTYTLNTSFGSGAVADGAGFRLNNEMDDFSMRPGTPNYYVVVGTTANEIRPCKHVLPSMSPTILLDGGRPRMVMGTRCCNSACERTMLRHR